MPNVVTIHNTHKKTLNYQKYNPKKETTKHLQPRTHTLDLARIWYILLRLRPDLLTEVLVHLVEHAIRLLPNLLPCRTQMHGHVVDEVFLRPLSTAKDVPQVVRLLIITVVDAEGKVCRSAYPLLVRLMGDYLCVGDWPE